MVIKLAEGMESRWYVPPGQSLSTTKIADRQLALHVTADAWKNVTKHLDRKRLIQEEIDRNVAYRKAMKEGSESMTKNWSNSVERMRQLKEEAPRKRREKEAEEKMNKYLQLRKEQERIRQEYVDKSRKTIYTSTEYPRRLNGALVLSHVLKEREKQVELAEKIKKHQREEEEIYAEKVKAGVAEEEMEKEEERIQQLKKKAKLKKLYISEMENKLRQQREQRQLELSEAAAANIAAAKEFEEMKRIELEEKSEKKRNWKESFNKYLDGKRQREEMSNQERIEQDQIIEIVSEYEQRIKYMTKQKQKEIQDEMVQRKIAAGKLAAAAQKSKDEEEERILKKAEKEKEEKEEEERLAKELKQKQLKEELKIYRKELHEKQKIREEEEAEIKKWEILNRYKQDEVIKQYDEIKKQKDKEKLVSYRKQLLEQMAENEERFKKEKEEEEYVIDTTEEDDKKFFSYAEEVRELVKSKGQSTYPVDRVISDYKKAIGFKQSVSAKESKETQDKKLISTKPGRMCHDPKTDPTSSKKKQCGIAT